MNEEMLDHATINVWRFGEGWMVSCSIRDEMGRQVGQWGTTVLTLPVDITGRSAASVLGLILIESLSAPTVRNPDQ